MPSSLGGLMQAHSGFRERAQAHLRFSALFVGRFDAGRMARYGQSLMCRFSALFVGRFDAGLQWLPNHCRDSRFSALFVGRFDAGRHDLLFLLSGFLCFSALFVGRFDAGESPEHVVAMTDLLFQCPLRWAV